jgi:hypothetical protein
MKIRRKSMNILVRAALAQCRDLCAGGPYEPGKCDRCMVGQAIRQVGGSFYAIDEGRR